MNGNLKALVEPGERCIVYVNNVNTPSGWWWGIVDAVESHGHYARCEARITGAFRVDENGKPVYGSENRSPHLNYQVYPANAATMEIVLLLTSGESKLRAELTTAQIQRDELRKVATMAQEEAIRKIVKAELQKAGVWK